MANIKLTDHNWHASGIYDTNQNKSQATINSDVATKMGSAQLETTSQNLSGGVNELKGRADTAEAKVDNLVTVSNTQPSSQYNKVWLPITVGEGTQVPTWSEHQALADDISDLNGAISSLEDDIAIIVNGKQSTTGASLGQLVLLRNSTISGLADGIYRATSAIPANTDITSSYLAAFSGGGLNGIPEVVTNANGTAYKFPSGFMICKKSVTASAACTSAWGSLYESDYIDLGNWAVAFTDRPTTVVVNAGGQGGWVEYVVMGTASYCGKTILVRPTANTADVTFDIVGYGMYR